jgi:small GTP-binding protein
MIKKKICMIGAVAVGKTSLVRRFVHGTYSERYLTTIGVKVDKKVIEADGAEVTLQLWDLAGEDAFTQLQTAYLRGASGYFVVVDGTRPETLEKAFELHQRARVALGPVPCTFLLNKSDLEPDWGLPPESIAELGKTEGVVARTSAKSGDGVESAFVELTRRMLSA